MLGTKIEAVPHFMLLGMRFWLECCVAWLGAEHGVFLNTSIDPQYGEPLPLHLINGVSPRGIRHAVIGNTVTGDMAHDPHPSRAGLSFINSRFYFYRNLK